MKQLFLAVLVLASFTARTQNLFLTTCSSEGEIVWEDTPDYSRYFVVGNKYNCNGPTDSVEFEWTIACEDTTITVVSDTLRLSYGSAVLHCTVVYHRGSACWGVSVYPLCLMEEDECPQIVVEKVAPSQPQDLFEWEIFGNEVFFNEPVWFIKLDFYFQILFIERGEYFQTQNCYFYFVRDNGVSSGTYCLP